MQLIVSLVALTNVWAVSSLTFVYSTVETITTKRGAEGEKRVNEKR